MAKVSQLMRGRSRSGTQALTFLSSFSVGHWPGTRYVKWADRSERERSVPSCGVGVRMGVHSHSLFNYGN